MEVISCSSTCICYDQLPGSLTCDNGGNVKESCTNSCNADSQGSFLQISNYNGCGVLQVPDDKYFCPCTKMIDNDVCTSVTPSGSIAPSPIPMEVPTNVPTPPTNNLCNVMDVLGQTLFIPGAGACWRVQLATGGTLEGDFSDSLCSEDEADWSSTKGVFSIFDSVSLSANTAVFVVGTNGYSGTFQFKEDAAVIKPFLEVLGWKQDIKEFELQVTIPTCSTGAICPTMKVDL